MIKIDKFAPVIIPTLSRYEHFRKCFESLEKCTYAEETDVYVGLDYPPSEKYIEGWKKIDRYLQEKEKSNNFKHLFVRRRECNCGVGTINSNVALLAREVINISDRYIATEDDNEFSPCFLDFMNQCLEKYKDDPKVVTVSGYTHPFFYDATKPLIFTYDNSGWGMGLWQKKEEERKRTLNGFHRSILFSFRKTIKLFVNYPLLLSNLISMLTAGRIYGDTMRTCENILRGTYQIRPYVSLVRNIGVDGTGLHCDSRDQKFYETQKILELKVFPFEQQNPTLSVSKWKMWKFCLFPNTLEKIRIVLASFYFYVKFRFQNKKES